jgi:hypothetical protein
MRNSGLLDFCYYLENTPFSLAIQSNFWVVPTMQTLHILAISALLIGIIMINLRVLNLHGTREPISVVVERYIHLIWIALPILLITGSIMIIGEPARSLANPAFQMKMIMLFIALMITFWLQRMWPTHSFQNNAHQMSRLLAVLSSALWIGIISAGRWIAYT